MQIEVVTVKFNKGVHGYWFSPNGFDVKVNDKVIVDTEKGKELVTVTKGKELVDEGSLADGLKNIIKIADENDIKMAEENTKKAEALLPEIRKLVKNEGLDMKVVYVEANYNFSKLTINFVSEGRVDFRELVKKLVEKYKTRIELRQIGPREETRYYGGLGVCGKECCCAQGFGIDDHVSIKMAKNQGLSLNPNNISGLCGKLLCCLAYENPYYVEVMKEMPKVGSEINTPDGRGKVIYNDLIKKTVSVKFVTENTSEIKTYEVADLKKE